MSAQAEPFVPAEPAPLLTPMEIPLGWTETTFVLRTHFGGVCTGSPRAETSASFVTLRAGFLEIFSVLKWTAVGLVENRWVESAGVRFFPEFDMIF